MCSLIEDKSRRLYLTLPERHAGFELQILGRHSFLDLSADALGDLRMQPQPPLAGG
jgi:hypothetical protein